MRKLLVLVVFALFINGCGKSDDSVVEEPVDNATYSDGSIDIEGVSGLQYASLTVQSIDNTASVNADGTYTVNQEPSDDEELPLLFLKDGKIIFGYFSQSDSDKSLSIDDMLVFYFRVHPEIAQYGIGNTDLLGLIKSNENYEDLKSKISTSLDSNSAPFDDSSFVELLVASGYQIAWGNKSSKPSKSNKKAEEDIYQFTYTRDGKISWEKEFPIFATVGMEIINSKGEHVFGPALLETSSLVASPGSLMKWVFDKLTEDVITNTASKTLTNDETYTINFTNGIDGIGLVALEEKVDLVNRFNIGAGLVCAAIPIGAKKFLKEDKCRDELIKLFGNMGLTALNTVAGNNFKWDEFVDKMHDAIYDAVKPCIESVNYTYLDKIKAFTAPFNKWEEGSELALLIRDYVISDISGTEKRNFYNGLSFGDLTYTNISAEDGINSKTEFYGVKDSEHVYTALVSEDLFEYGIESDLVFQSTIKQRTNQPGALGLPFEVVITGDATLKENSTIYTDSEGKLTMTFIMGDEDSQVEIKPAFINSGITPEVIHLLQPKYKIGDLHAGGVIFYVNETGEHGLVCALQDQANEVEWGCDGLNISGAENKEIGKGLENTKAIIQACDSPDIAARHAYSGDWFLPSYRELEELAKNQKIVEETAVANGGDEFTPSFYYSSTQTGSAFVYLIHFRYGYTIVNDVYQFFYGYRTEVGLKWRKVYHVRAVKEF